MLTRKEIIGILKKEHSYLKSEFGVKRMAIFGSFANGSANKKSDVDIVIEFDKPPGMGFFRRYV
jgi:predicted nucleotidyltransferase